MIAELIEKCPVRNGLRDVTMDEFWKNPLIVCETLERKLRGLPVDQARYPGLADDIIDALHLLRAVALRNYGAISMLAVHDIILAVDYFLVLRDECEDSRLNGYMDDAEKLRETFSRNAEELSRFKRWFSGG